jgi:hypothetical protein
MIKYDYWKMPALPAARLFSALTEGATRIISVAQIARRAPSRLFRGGPQFGLPLRPGVFEPGHRISGVFRGLRRCIGVRSAIVVIERVQVFIVDRGLSRCRLIDYLFHSGSVVSYLDLVNFLNLEKS